MVSLSSDSRHFKFCRLNFSVHQKCCFWRLIQLTAVETCGDIKATTTPKKEGTMGNRPSYAIASALIAAAGVQAQDSCSCSPTRFEFVLTLNQTCDTNGTSTLSFALELVSAFLHIFLALTIMSFISYRLKYYD